MPRPTSLQVDPPLFENLCDWLTPAEVRGYLRISRSSTYELIRSKAIPSRRFGRRLLVPKYALKPDLNQTPMELKP